MLYGDRLMKLAVMAGLCLGLSAGAQAQTPIPFHEPFANNSIVLSRVGGPDLATANLTGNAMAVALDEFRITSGAGASASISYAQSLYVPTTGAGRHTNLGSGARELQLTRTSVGGSNYLFFAGYDAAPGTAGITTAAPTSVPRVVSRVDQSGAINSTTRMSTAFSAAIMGAASPDGVSIAFSGDANAGGLRTTTLGSNTSTSAAPVNNMQSVNYVGSQLYAMTSTSLDGHATRLLSVTGNVATPIVTASASRAFGDFFFAGPNTLYIADTGAHAADLRGGLVRYDFNGSVWSETYEITIPDHPSVTNGFLAGLVGLSGTYDPISGRVDIYGTTAEARATRLIGITDFVGNNAGGLAAVSTLYTNPFSISDAANSFFRSSAWRGVEVFPVPAPGTAALLALGGLMTARRRR